MAQAAYLRTETIPLDQLQQFPGNARRGDVDTILNSLRRNGQYRSLVVRQIEPGQYVTLAGNHTAQALIQHGADDCGQDVKTGEADRPCGVCGNGPWQPAARCEVVTCDEETARRINIVDNRSTELGEWDEEALAELISALGDDLDGTGYTEEDLVDLEHAIEEAADEETFPDEEKQAPPGPATTPGAPNTTAPNAASSGASAPPLLPPLEQVTMTLTYLPADRDEAARLVSNAREVFPNDAAPEIVLRALRALTALLDSRHAHDGVVTVAELLRAAGAELP